VARQRYVRTVSPTISSIISSSYVKNYLKVDGSEDDTLIDNLIAAAVTDIEEYLWRGFGESTWELELDEWIDEIVIRKNPIQSVSSVTYWDTDNASQTLATSEYKVFKGVPGLIILDSKPGLYDRIDAVKVTFTAGESTVPESIKTAVLQMVAHMYENRGEDEEIHLEEGYVNKVKNRIYPLRYKFY